MSAHSAAGQRKQDAEARAKIRACFDLELMHIRCGDWRSTKGSTVELVGLTSRLHGTVCTCCRGSRHYQGAGL